MEIREGTMPFKGFHTWYRIVNPEGRNTPLMLLHGGPGSTHNYFEGFDPLAEATDRPIIMYDQIGCGQSMVTGHPELFTAEVWMEELKALREHLELGRVHILGQSWGGMLAIWYALEGRPEGVKSFILSSTLPSASMWEMEQYRRIAGMSLEDRRAIQEAVASGDYSGAHYLNAVDRFMERYCASEVTEDSPAYLKRPRRQGREAYEVGWGPNEFTPTGTLSGFEVTDRLHEISQPCLVTSGQTDLCSPWIAKTMADAIPGARWELFRTSRHMPFIEEEERYMEIMESWLAEHD